MNPGGESVWIIFSLPARQELSSLPRSPQIALPAPAWTAKFNAAPHPSVSCTKAKATPRLRKSPCAPSPGTRSNYFIGTTQQRDDESQLSRAAFLSPEQNVWGWRAACQFQGCFRNIERCGSEQMETFHIHGIQLASKLWMNECIKQKSVKQRKQVLYYRWSNSNPAYRIYITKHI